MNSGEQQKPTHWEAAFAGCLLGLLLSVYPVSVAMRDDRPELPQIASAVYKYDAQTKALDVSLIWTEPLSKPTWLAEVIFVDPDEDPDDRTFHMDQAHPIPLGANCEDLSIFPDDGKIPYVRLAVLQQGRVTVGKAYRIEPLP